MGPEITPLFRNVLMVCAQEGLIGRQMFAIDGCKISSNCGKEWSATRADYERKKRKLEEPIEVLVRTHRNADEQDVDTRSMAAKEGEAIERLRGKVKKIEAWLATSEDKQGPRGDVKKNNITDNESAKMPSAHAVIQGYNGIAAVDSKHQVIVHAEAFGEGQEKQLLRPMLVGVRENFTGIGQGQGILQTAVLVADNGYHSEENVRHVFEEGIDAYLPDNRFRKRDPAFASASRHRKPVDRRKTRRGSRWFEPRDFRYNPDRTKLICPAGKESYLKNRNFRSTDGRRGVSYMGRKTECRTYALRSRCLRREQTEARQVVMFDGRGADGSKTFTQRMIERFDTKLGRFYYSRRLGIIEPVLANVAATLGLNRFSLRGRVKVDVQWKLYCIVHNLLKSSRYGVRFA